MSLTSDQGYRLVGGYEILSELKSGGMGEVLLARRRGAHGFEKLVAIKTIRNDMEGRGDVRAMFLDEARLVAQLSHPAIAQVYDFGEEEGRLFLVMEYVDGVSFADLCKHFSPSIPPGVVARAMAEVCRGLHAAHEATDLEGKSLGVVHRDISPQNLMLTFSGRAKILDFGIAQTIDRSSPETRTGLVKGKPAYMSPEQLDGDTADRRVDIFAASIVLYEVLTGRRLFVGETPFQVADAVRHGDIPLPSKTVESIPPELDEAVMRGLARDREARFHDAAAMAGALEEIANRMGAESLESYARRDLVAAREEHERYLRNVVSGTDIPVHEPERSGRPIEVGTVASGSNPTGSPRRMDLFGGELETQSTIPIDNDDLPPVPKGPLLSAGPRKPGGAPGSTGEALTGTGQLRSRGSRLRVAAAVIALAFGVVVGATLAWKRPWRSDAAVPPTTVGSTHAGPLSPSAAKAEKKPALAEVVAPDRGDRAATKGKEKDTKRRPRQKKKTLAPKNDPENGAPADTALETEPQPPAFQSFGHVKIVATPYADVYVDGKFVGHTPLMRHSLVVGPHEIELRSPDSDTVRYNQVVTIDKGEQRTIKIP